MTQTTKKEWALLARGDLRHNDVVMRLVQDAIRCAELEAKIERCSLDNECYVCPPLRCGTFKRGPAGCSPLKAAEQKIAKLQTLVAAAREMDECMWDPDTGENSIADNLHRALAALDAPGPGRYLGGERSHTMGNGHGPPRELSDTDYQKIKSGTVVTAGTYAGCVQVGESTYYWVSPDDTDWALNEGTPDSSQASITSDVWDACKDGGEYDWDSRDQSWYDESSTEYRWAGYSGQDVELHEM